MSQMVTLEQATWAWIEAGPRKHNMPVGKRFVKGIMAGFCKCFLFYLLSPSSPVRASTI